MSAAAPNVLTVRLSLAATALYGVLVLLLYYATAASMVAIWERSDTFAHGYLILPISLWLVWTRRDYLAAVVPRPAPWVALLLPPLVALWLLAVLVDVLVVQQLALVALLVVGSWAVLGHRLALVLAFPLLFLFFAVPMGEGLIPPMMDFTAWSTVWLIQQTGIPVYREGLFFALPSGRWSVVEACSGVRYIIASTTVGALFAYLTYVSTWRRLLFFVISIIVPIFANTLRAYIIVMLGHFSGMKMATGADHLVYGWVFFGIVIFILFWLGSFFREDAAPPQRAGEFADGEERRRAKRGSVVIAVIVALVCAALGPIAASRLAVERPAINYAASSAVVAEPVASAEQTILHNWQPYSAVAGSLRHVVPHEGTDVLVLLQYRDAISDPGDVIGSSARFIGTDDAWRVVEHTAHSATVDDESVSVHSAELRGPDGSLRVWSWYLLGETQTANDYIGKLQQAAASIGVAPGGELRILLATPVLNDADNADNRLQSFIDRYGDRMLESLRATHRAASE